MNDENNNINDEVLSNARQYFIELAKRSDEFRKCMEESETRTKRNYFQKKLKQNNKEAIKILAKIELFEQLEQTKKDDQ